MWENGGRPAHRQQAMAVEKISPLNAVSNERKKSGARRNRGRTAPRPVKRTMSNDKRNDGGGLLPCCRVSAI